VLARVSAAFNQLNDRNPNMSFVKAQKELIANLVEQIREVTDYADTEKRGLLGEEVSKINRIEEEIRSAESAVQTAERAEARLNAAADAARDYRPSVESRSDADILRSIARGEVRGHEFEKRLLVSSDNTVPKSFYDEVFSVARLVGPMLDVSQVIATSTGESLTIPTLTAYSTATIKGQGTAIAESDPVFSSITLGAYKYSFLVPVANELLNDAGFDISSLIAEQAGNAIGYAVNAALTTGTGTVQPTGVVTAAGSGVTGGTSVAGAFTADNLIDLAYSLDGAARRLPGVGFMANTQSVGAMRKLKDSAGNYLYQVGVGQPDAFAGFPIYENPAMAAIGTAAKSVVFGHLPSYKVRMAGGLQIAQSSDYAFNTDVTTFRVLMRVDGNLTHSGHIKYFAGAAS
jgi:HK97 family phage major capsid protein